MKISVLIRTSKAQLSKTSSELVTTWSHKSITLWDIPRKNKKGSFVFSTFLNHYATINLHMWDEGKRACSRKLLSQLYTWSQTARYLSRNWFLRHVLGKKRVFDLLIDRLRPSLTAYFSNLQRERYELEISTQHGYQLWICRINHKKITGIILKF